MKVVIEKDLNSMYKNFNVIKNGKSNVYPEIDKQFNISKNDIVFEMVRNCLINMELDKENIGTNKWNPLKEYIKEGDTVLLKPNMVLDKNLGGDSTDCLYTNPNIVYAILVYVFIALKRTGKVIVADAPVQQCNFENLINKSGYNNIKK